MDKTISIEARLHQIDVLPLLDRAFDYFFSAYIFVTIFLPSGTIYGLNFKSPLYVGLLPLAAFSLFRRGEASSGRLVLMLAVPMFTFCWAVLGLADGFSLVAAQRQFSDILLTFLICWLAFIFCKGEQSRRLQFLRLVSNSVAVTAALKVGLILYTVSRGIPVVQMVAWLDQIFGSDLMTMNLGVLFGRVQFISDELIPVSIYLILRHRHELGLGPMRASLTVLLLLTSVLYSFSRFFWGFSAVALAMGLLLGKRDKFQALLATLLMAVVLVSLPALTGLYELRFSSGVAGESDSLRTEQIPALQDFFLDSPIFGHGLGSYTYRLIRGTTEEGRYAYEVQLLALASQIGLIGMFLLLTIAMYYFRDLWQVSGLRLVDRLGIGLLLACWIAAGLSNPLLFHPLAGVNYAALAALARMGSSNLGHKSVEIGSGRTTAIVLDVN